MYVYNSHLCLQCMLSKTKGLDEADEAAFSAVATSLASEDASIPSRGRERLGQLLQEQTVRRLGSTALRSSFLFRGEELLVAQLYLRVLQPLHT